MPNTDEPAKQETNSLPINESTHQTASDPPDGVPSKHESAQGEGCNLMDSIKLLAREALKKFNDIPARHRIACGMIFLLAQIVLSNIIIAIMNTLQIVLSNIIAIMNKPQIVGSINMVYMILGILASCVVLINFLRKSK